MRACTPRTFILCSWLAAVLGACSTPVSAPPTLITATPAVVATSIIPPTSVVLTAAPTTPPTAMPTLSPAPTAVAWQTLRSQFARFRIELPGVPTEASDEKMSAIGPLQSYTATLALDQQHTILINALLTPELFRPDGDATALLEAQRDALVRAAGAQTVLEQAVLAGPFVGRDLTLDTGDTRSLVRLYTVDNAVYQLSLRFPRADQGYERDVAPRVLGSFALLAPLTTALAWRIVPLAHGSVAMPQPPKLQRSNGPGPAETGLKIITYTLNQTARHVRWWLSISDAEPNIFSGGPRAADPGAVGVIDTRRVELIQSTAGTDVYTSTFRYGTAIGEEAHWQLPAGGFVRIRFLCIGDRLYEQGVQTENAMPSPADATEPIPSVAELAWFFLSFTPEPSSPVAATRFRLQE